MSMKPNQMAAIKKLESALLSCKRAGLVLVGIDDNLFATVKDHAFQEEMRNKSACEAALERNNAGHELTDTVEHYGAYLDSGGA